MSDRAASFLRRLFRRTGPVGQPTSHECPVLVSSAVTDYCITHHTTGCAGMGWSACRFRQLFYFENPMDEHTLTWADENRRCFMGTPMGYGCRRPTAPGELWCGRHG